MNIHDIKNRIEGQCPNIQKLGFLTGINDIEVEASDMPAAFIFWGDDSAAQNDGLGTFTSQLVTRTVSILLIDKVPDENSDYMEELRGSIYAALVGWHDLDSQIEFSGGNVDKIVSGAIHWRDNFQFNTYLRFNR